MESMHLKETRKMQQTMETHMGITISDMKVKHERELEKMKKELLHEHRVTQNEAIDSLQATQVSERESLSLCRFEHIMHCHCDIGLCAHYC